MASSAAASGNVCFNSNCKEFVEKTRKGWRRRTGEFAELCDRCGSAYDDGKFCDAFHLNSSGWRSCESCGKQIHCGCIVSFHTFVLLDAGGIECIACARKSFILPERIKDVNNWNPIAGSGPVPWRQAPSLFNASTNQNELQHKAPFPETTVSIDRLSLSERPFALLSDNNRKDSGEKLMNGKLKIGVPGTLENGYAGFNREEAHKSCTSAPWQSSYANSDLSAPSFCLTVGSTCKNEPTVHSKVSVSVQQQNTLSIPLPLGKQLGGHATVDSAGETQVRSSKIRGDGRGKNQLLPRYWPRITDQELRRLSEDSNSVITPLFEKMLSASDAGRIGRLVLPKKCAEAYFPPISNPEGLPLKMQDLKGKEWMFQFRFWPNNNSRMYVLEGVTPCIQSMQLQAGDIVTFSRIEPEGKLVMGCRKASNILTTDQGSEACSNGNGVATNGNASTKHTKFSEEVLANSTKKGFSSTTHVAATSARDETKMSDDLVNESLGNNRPIRCKRKGSTMGSKRKRLRIDNDNLVELKVTVVQAQGLMRPPSSGAPTVIVIEGCEFEEYEQEDAPIIGRPTIPHMDQLGAKIQWVQCEDCFKWRKVPDNVDLPSRWTCSDNSRDPERSMCSAVQELTADHLRDLLPHINKASKKRRASKQEMDLVETLDGLDALAHLAILEEGETLPASPQATTKHPRHRPGCTCIVCIQPPSGKGPKHKQSCDCNVCKSVKRRFKTLMLKREKKLSEKEAEATCQKLQPQSAGQLLDAVDIQESIDDAAHLSPQHGELNNEGSVDPNYLNEKKSSVDDPSYLNEKKSSVDDPNYLNEKKSSVDDPSYLNEKKSSVDDPNYLNEKKSSVDDPSYLNEKKSSVDDPNYLNEKKSSVDDPNSLNEKESSVDDPNCLNEKKSSVDDPNCLTEKKSSVDDPNYVDERKSSVDDPNYLTEKKSSASPFKGEFDLNAKPERDDELSPGSDSGSMIRIIKRAAEQYVRHCENGSSVGNQINGDGAGETNPSNCVIVSGSQQTDVDHNRPLPISTAASLAPNDQ
ncbi:B3 domain-containing protein Os07g0563300 isoform X3 [Solanum tuberosum]|uniref:B3 domain-containing protein Os07g0563300 isoform X3 n=1 Tax=Solanum tuberosum TaxID=4113 RepID=UPI00073A1E64|nr:PREDICTED: B3 domain-containing protein Os07g0563300 isoform X3 [Solanum tuberosum]